MVTSLRLLEALTNRFNLPFQVNLNHQLYCQFIQCHSENYERLVFSCHPVCENALQII